MAMKFKNSTKISFSTLLFCICVSFSARSQVTIGSNSNPLKGALLDLKENDETDGMSNSTNGLILPRVFLKKIDSLAPMLTGLEDNYESLKPRYTGLTVFNVNPDSPFEKGMYIWDGARWCNTFNGSSFTSVTAKNGLTIGDADTILLGGDLVQNTILDLNDYNLVFNRNHGMIGVGTDDPKAIIHIENPDFDDPLILGNVKYISDPYNEIDGPPGGAEPTYYDLLISEYGVVRKAHPVTINLNQSVLYVLSADTDIAAGDVTGSGTSGGGGSILSWTGPGTDNNPVITLPEDGAYVFSFSLNGTWTQGTGSSVDSNTFYISAFLNGTDPATNLVDIAELVAYHTTYNAMSYSINLTLTGKAGDSVRFKIAVYYPDRNAFTWRLLNNKTSMIFWRL